MVAEQKETENYTTAIAIIFTSIVIAILGIAVPARILWNKNTEVAKTVGIKKEVRQKLTIKLANLKNLESRKEELASKNAKVIEAIPKDYDIPRLFVQFENIGNLSGFFVEKATEENQMTLMATGQSTSPAIPSITPVSYIYQGKSTSYIQVKNAVQRLETALRVLSIRSLELDKQSSNIFVKIGVTTYKRSSE